VSGRAASLILVGGCVLLVTLALLSRARGTQQVRAFWTPRGAALIQRAPRVRIAPVAPWGDPSDLDGTGRHETAGSTAPHWTDPQWLDQLPWQEISAAPGLIHLRATLVDDRYFVWPAVAAEPREVMSPAAELRALEFSDSSGSIVVILDVRQGWVIHPAGAQRVRLLGSSRAALEAYLPRIEDTARHDAAVSPTP
jgi:hypothetical protein